MSYTNYRTLVEGFEQSVLSHPEHTALALHDEIITYKELYSSAKDQALFLLSSIKKEKLRRVAIFTHRNKTAYIGTLAALMTGASFIPLNSRFPAERNISILKQCNPDVIIVDKNSINELIKISALLKLPCAVFFPNGEIDNYKDKGIIFLNLNKITAGNFIELPKINSDDDAYILFTSGSTGQPKGVPIKHRNVCSFLKQNQKRYNISHSDRFSQTFDQTFDLSVFDLFMAWCHGAAVYAMRSIDLISPSKYINENKITVWFSVPSVISLLSKQGFLKKDCFPSLRLSLFCGEPLLERQICAWADSASNSICENLYGPTELTISCSAYRWKRSKKNVIHNDIVSIGNLYDNMKYILLDESSNQVKGEGELCVAGEQRFVGYLNPASSSTFISLINDKKEKEIYYKTGDRVKVNATGELLYLGRTDQQVKINGYRIELGEIESAFLKMEGIDRAFVFCIEKDDQNQPKKLAAYVVGNISFSEIIEKSKKILPSYMIPLQIKIGKAFPLNANGKVDRKALISYLI